jgi:hypothetical protein
MPATMLIEFGHRQLADCGFSPALQLLGLVFGLMVVDAVQMPATMLIEFGHRQLAACGFSPALQVLGLVFGLMVVVAVQMPATMLIEFGQRQLAACGFSPALQVRGLVFGAAMVEVVLQFPGWPLVPVLQVQDGATPVESDGHCAAVVDPAQAKVEKDVRLATQLGLLQRH